MQNPKSISILLFLGLLCAPIGRAWYKGESVVWIDLAVEAAAAAFITLMIYAVFRNTAPGTASEWMSWPRFQSKDVRDIYANMTDAEKSTATRWGSLYGIWCAFSFVVPLIFMTFVALPGLMTGNLHPAVALTCGLLMVAHVACIPIVHRRQRQFLCSTSWARENGFEWDALKLFKWRDDRN